MSQESIKLWGKDPYLVVLYKEICLGLRFYRELLEDQGDTDKLRNHKYSVLNLQEEIEKACKNNPHWQRGRVQLDTLIEIRYEFRSYFNIVFEQESTEAQRVKFADKHQEFYASLRLLLNLFAA